MQFITILHTADLTQSAMSNNILTRGLLITADVAKSDVVRMHTYIVRMIFSNI